MGSHHHLSMHCLTLHAPAMKMTGNRGRFWCRASAIAQAGSAGLLGLVHAQDLPFCMVLQTMAFVAFNKVRFESN